VQPGPAALFYRGESQSPGAVRDLSVEDETERAQRRGLLCRACSIPVTTEKERIEKEGRHLHTFFNPAGIVYEIGCFRSAPGCLSSGPPSSEFAWFSGYSWQVACCRNCQEHLGWIFRGEDEFYGLIVKKLKEN